MTWYLEVQIRKNCPRKLILLLFFLMTVNLGFLKKYTVKVSFLARDREFFVPFRAVPYRDISYRDRDRDRDRTRDRDRDRDRDRYLFLPCLNAKLISL